jgi:sec-independent protein translocase protein TatC
MPITPKRMAFFEHLGELRRRLAIVLGAIFVLSLAFYFPALEIFEYLMLPLEDALEGTPFVATSPFEQFTIRFGVALLTAFVVTAPLWIYQFLAFFLPALKPVERRWAVPIFFAMLFFFLLGVAFCWYFVLGPGFEWLLSQGGDTIETLPKASEFFQGVALFLLGFGIAFETPVLVFGLVVLGIVPYESFRKNWRIAYIVIMVVASIATPDWSPVTMLALFAAMLVLYEGSLLMARILLRKRIAEQREATA